MVRTVDLHAARDSLDRGLTDQAAAGALVALAEVAAEIHGLLRAIEQHLSTIAVNLDDPGANRP